MVALSFSLNPSLAAVLVTLNAVPPLVAPKWKLPKFSGVVSVLAVARRKSDRSTELALVTAYTTFSCKVALSGLVTVANVPLRLPVKVIRRYAPAAAVPWLLAPAFSLRASVSGRCRS